MKTHCLLGQLSTYLAYLWHCCSIEYLHTCTTLSWWGRPTGHFPCHIGGRTNLSYTNLCTLYWIIGCILGRATLLPTYPHEMLYSVLSLRACRSIQARRDAQLKTCPRVDLKESNRLLYLCTLYRSIRPGGVLYYPEKCLSDKVVSKITHQSQDVCPVCLIKHNNFSLPPTHLCT